MSVQEKIIWTHLQGMPCLQHKCRYWPQHTFIAWVPLYGVFIPKWNLTMQHSYSREFFTESHYSQLLQCVCLLCLGNTDDFHSLYSHDAPCPARNCEFGCSICISTSCSRGRHTGIRSECPLKHTQCCQVTNQIRSASEYMAMHVGWH